MFNGDCLSLNTDNGHAFLSCYVMLCHASDTATRTPDFLKKSKVRKSNVRLGSIAHTFFVCEYDFVRLPNSIQGLGSIVSD